jgi:hypothetical protein
VPRIIRVDKSDGSADGDDGQWRMTLMVGELTSEQHESLKGWIEDLVEWMNPEVPS